MANSVPTLTNENWHMFEPSPIETSLAANVDNPLTPSARGNLFRYQTQSQLSGQNYQDQVDRMHAAQIAEGMAAQDNARRNTMLTGLKIAGETPGAVQAMISGGLAPQGMDLSGVDAGAAAKAAALNMHNVGTGAGSLGQAGFTGLGPAVASAFGPGVEQGSPAMVQAASINAAGRVAAAGGAAGRVTGHLDNYGDMTYSGRMMPGETPDQFKARLGGGAAPPPTVMGKPIKSRSGGGGGGGMTSLPPAPSFVTGGDDSGGYIGGDGTNNPLTGGIPAAMMPPQAQTTQPAATSTDTAKAQVVAAIQRELPKIQQANPGAYADIHAAGVINPVPYRGGWAIKGASGKTYPLGGAAQ